MFWCFGFFPPSNLSFTFLWKVKLWILAFHFTCLWKVNTVDTGRIDTKRRGIPAPPGIFASLSVAVGA